jgi:hypothetical protein
MFWGTRFVAKIPDRAGVLTRSTAGGRELGLADRPPAPFTSLSGIKSWMGHELTALENGAHFLRGVGSDQNQIKLAMGMKMMF